ncbi:MAG: ABC transporter permease subunit [Phycisphaerales bacterium]|nr:ABC transporter permease subunit [Phycisphaerales bacterium]MCB9836616.1 ABC transporter permease subunit [Phycisphaera sp.]
MTTTLTIARRELSSLFRTPVGWIVLALFLFLTGTVFVFGALAPGQPATLRPLFGTTTLMLVLVAPAISMRLFSEEFRTGTYELLASSPVTSAQIVLGKYLGALAFLILMLLPTLIHAGTLALVSDPSPDPGPIAAGYLSLFLFGCLCLSLGTLASTLTDSQTLAFLGTMLTLICWVLITNIAPQHVGPEIGSKLAAASYSIRIDDFARGTIDTRHVVFFLSISAGLLTFATSALEARRWR